MDKIVYDQTGQGVDKVQLSKSVFDQDKVNHQLLHQVYQAGLANLRLSSASTKNRCLIVGSSRKLFRQKGNRFCSSGFNQESSATRRRGHFWTNRPAEL